MIELEPGSICTDPDRRWHSVGGSTRLRLCGKPAKRIVQPVSQSGDRPMGEPRAMCGLHARMHEARAAKYAERVKSEAGARQRRKEIEVRRGVATNLAHMLADAIRDNGGPAVSFLPNAYGTELTISVADAETLLRSLR